MADNFLPSVRDQRSLLLPAWEDWLLEGICPGSNIGLCNRFGDAFIRYPRPIIFDLPLSDGRESRK